jgi:FAS-associated factor 2
MALVGCVREEANMLRAQQDLEYQQAAEADRLASERRRQERLEREAYEEEMRQQAELEEAISLSTKLTHEARIKNLRESLAPEPPAGEDVATIRFQLPGSSKITRRFIKTSTIHHIHDFLAVHFNDIGSTVRNFSISTHFPKQELTDLTQTIDEVVSQSIDISL